MYDLLDQGLTPARIQSICKNRRSSMPQGQLEWQQAQVCVTQVGTCLMVQPAPVGVPCYCPTIYGPITGFAR